MNILFDDDDDHHHDHNYEDTLFLSAALLISLLASVFSPRATSQRTDSGAQYLE